ncbi:hypothetical protein [Caulobacter sp. X]|nr:hypothetical protein [Caulobacter sp. X]
MRKLSSEDMNIIGALLLIFSIGFLVGFAGVMLSYATTQRRAPVEAGGTL